ncbi:MAG TPA: UvrD-helicase domain-containing protein [Steroidobacteraceae bacterium]|nr:UvrD-helicase domain-containing protein [Steroidobacteraceae bacterium]
MTERAASDRAARRGAIETRGSVLVQAPAGSGKTTLLVQRYLRLLALVDAPERILALTFTRRAAQEMRERVLLALDAARLQGCPSDMNPETWELARAAQRHLDATLLDVRRQPSRLRIETIDAFNAWLAGQLPIAAGAGSAFQVLTDAEPSYEEAARRALAQEAGDRFGAAVDRVLAIDDQRWSKLQSMIAGMLRERDRWLPLLAGRLRAASALDEAQLEQVRRQFNEDLQLLVSRVLRRALETLGAERVSALSALAHGASRRMPADRRQLSDWLEDATPLRAQAADLARWRAAAWLTLTGQGEFRRRLTRNEGFPPQCADHAPMADLLEEFSRDPHARQVLIDIRALPEPAYSDEQWGRVGEVAQVLVLAAAQLDQVFREQGAADFAAVSLAALRALGSAEAPSDLGLRLDYRLQHILVDEFQDTSSAQLELVRLLTAGWQQGDGRSVFCVGDPMQSIYGFRQAEVRAFLELAEDGIGEVRFEVQRLRDNFRSGRSLVDWVNACFARVLPRIDDRDRGAIAFHPSEAVIADPEASRAASVALSGYATRAEEAAAIADMVADAARQNPNWRIAVLVRARTHAREIAAGFRARGVTFRAVEIEPLQDRAVVRDVIMLTCALLHLGDRTAWLAVLRAPWAGVSLADLLQISRAAPLVWEALGDEAVLQRLSEDGQARCRRLYSTLEAAFRVRSDGSLARWVERTWLGLGGASCAASPQDLELADAAFGRLRDLEQRGLPDAADLPESFADLYADHGAVSHVEIMTIHKAKGLEFDMVVLPALDRHVPHSRDRLLLTHQFARTGRDGMVMAARPGVGADDDRLFEFLRRQLREAAGLEAQRLLYVGCTRAKWRLRLTATVGAPEKARPPRAGSLLAVIWPVLSAEFAVAEHATGPEAEAPGRDSGAPRGGPLARVPRNWAPRIEGGPFSSPPLSAPPALREELPVFDWAGETARRVGTLVHAELQAMSPTGSAASGLRAREPHYRRWLALHGVPAERLPEAASRVVEALIAVDQDPRGRWILQKARQEVREHALSGRLQGEVARVVFDRSFVDDQGVRWVIDYKTSRHIGGGLEEFLDREVERYRPQLQRYAQMAQKLGPEPVRLGLYFPLMRAWREWAA